MKYISNIRCGTTDHIRCLLWDKDDDLDISVSDTETGTTEHASAREIPNIDCFGFGRDYVEGEYLVVANTMKSVLLHKHLVEVSNSTGTVSLWDSRYDRCLMRRGKAPDNVGVVGNKWLAVDVGTDTLSVCGKLGCIASLQSSMMPGLFIYNLYDMLLFLCRECHLNIMTYEVAKFYSRSGNCTVTVVFDQSEKSRRFFTKMYLDGCSR